jgi:hypothetical protein
MAESLSFKNLKDQYFEIDKKFIDAFMACETDAQREQLKRDYVNARDNFWEARNRIFLDNDPLVKQMTKDLGKANAAIKEMLADLKDIVAVLDTITAGVRLGSSLITLGSSS